MDTRANCYSNLEPVLQPINHQFKGNSVKNLTAWDWITQLGRFLVNSLVGNDEPRINQTIDRLGNIVWQVYNPINRQILSFTSEQEVREWLEQRYY